MIISILSAVATVCFFYWVFTWKPKKNARKTSKLKASSLKYLSDWDKDAVFKEHIAIFLTNMKKVEDFYNVVIARSKWHQMEVSMGRKADDYDYFAKQHAEEYLNKYESNEEPDFYPDGLALRLKKFKYIVSQFEILIRLARKLGGNFPEPMFYDYCAARSSLKGVELAIELIEKEKH